MRIIIEIPDPEGSNARPALPQVEVTGETTQSVAPVSDAFSGGAAPQTARAVAQSNAVIGVDALSAGSAEDVASPVASGVEATASQNGGSAPA
jgi:hypothetical protein